MEKIVIDRWYQLDSFKCLTLDYLGLGNLGVSFHVDMETLEFDVLNG